MPRAVASLTVLGGQEFHFPHFFLKFRSIFLIFPQTLLIFFLILALRVGDSPTRKGPGYATVYASAVTKCITFWSASSDSYMVATIICSKIDLWLTRYNLVHDLWPGNGLVWFISKSLATPSRSFFLPFDINREVVILSPRSYTLEVTSPRKLSSAGPWYSSI